MSFMIINVCGQFEVAELLAHDLTSKEIESVLGIGKEELKARILGMSTGYAMEELSREEQTAVVRTKERFNFTDGRNLKTGLTTRLGIIVKVLGF